MDFEAIPTLRRFASVVRMFFYLNLLLHHSRFFGVYFLQLTKVRKVTIDPLQAYLMHLTLGPQVWPTPNNVL